MIRRGGGWAVGLDGRDPARTTARQDLVTATAVQG